MGLAMARRFAREEMNVVLSDIDESKLDAAVTEIQADGGNAQGVVTDVSLESDNVQLLDASIDVSGTVDVVCLNAGVQGFYRPFVGARQRTTSGRWGFCWTASFMAFAPSCHTL